MEEESKKRRAAVQSSLDHNGTFSRVFMVFALRKELQINRIDSRWSFF
jgi:hypothetical protein